MDVTWAGVILAVGLLVAIFSVAKKMKANSRKSMAFFGIALISLGAIAMSGSIAQLSGLNDKISFGDTLSVGGEEEVDLNVDVTGCDVGTKTTVTLSATDKYTTGAVGGYHRYKVNGNPAIEIADQGTFTASPGNTITVLWNNETSSGYYGSTNTYVLECTGAKTFSTQSVNNGTLTSSLKDSDDNTIDGSANNQTLGAGDVKDVAIKLSGEYKKDFPYGFVAVIEMNKTSMDDVVLSTDSGSVLTTATVPQSYSAVYGAESVKKAYFVPAIVSNSDLRLKATLDADDTINPGPGGSDAIIVLYPMNYFINEDNGGAFEGPSAEDEDNALTRDGGFTVTVHVD